MTASINLEEGALEIMSKGNLDEPVIMLNLLKYLDKAKFGFGVDGIDYEKDVAPDVALDLE